MPRDTLSREQIVQAAIELLDAEGIDGLSMRQLGARLGCAATAVYWHVQNKDRLVVLAADAVWAEIDLPDIAGADWRSALTAMAVDLFGMITRHPWLITAMSTHLIYGPGKARHDDHLLGILEAAGFGAAGADQAAGVVVPFVLGMALGATAETAWRSRLRRAGGDEEQRLHAATEEVANIVGAFPRLRARVQVEHVADPLASGLRAILDGLAAGLPA